MGGFSLWHWLVVGLIILLLFGKGRFSEMMGDVAKGLKSFKKGISEEDEAAPRRLPQDQPTMERPVDQRPPVADARPVDPAPEADRH